MTAASKKPSDMDRAFEQLQNAHSAADVTETVNFILANSGRAPSINLFLASAAAFAGKHLEDSAFLFYIGQMRLRYDLDRYPPLGDGGDNAALPLFAISQGLGESINPAIMREPRAFGAVLDRVQAWAPATPKGYEPGWEYKGGKSEAEAMKTAVANKQEMLRHFRDLVTLLNNPQYFAAFKAMQDANLAPFDEKQRASRAKTVETSQKTMTEIEKKLDIEGVFYRRK
jgi:hypothetical protein